MTNNNFTRTDLHEFEHDVEGIIIVTGPRGSAPPFDLNNNVYEALVQINNVKVWCCLHPSSGTRWVNIPKGGRAYEIEKSLQEFVFHDEVSGEDIVIQNMQE